MVISMRVYSIKHEWYIDAIGYALQFFKHEVDKVWVEEMVHVHGAYIDAYLRLSLC